MPVYVTFHESKIYVVLGKRYAEKPVFAPHACFKYMYRLFGLRHGWEMHETEITDCHRRAND